MSCITFVSLCVSGITLLFGLSFVMILVAVDVFEYGPGWQLVGLFLYVCLLDYVEVFCCYRCWSDVLSIACNYSSCFGDLCFV